MTSRKRARVEVDDPLADVDAAAAPRSADPVPPPQTAAEAAAAVLSRGAGGARGGRGRGRGRDTRGGLYDPKMKKVAAAAAGAARAVQRGGFFAALCQAPAPAADEERAAKLAALLAEVSGGAPAPGPGGEPTAATFEQRPAADIAQWFGPATVPVAAAGGRTFACTPPPLEPEGGAPGGDAFGPAGGGADAFDPFAVVPDVEPWDVPLLASPFYAGGPAETAVTDLIHHPAVAPGPNVSLEPPPPLLRKTPDEVRRERHKRRVAAAEERRALQRTGCAPLQTQRLFRRHQETSTALRRRVAEVGPTAVAEELAVLEAGRRLEHERRNHEAHHIAKPHQRAHWAAVLRRRAATRPVVAVWRVLGVGEDYRLTTVKIAAKDLRLRGAVLWVAQRMALIVVVGGQQPIAKLDRKIRLNTPWPPGSAAERVWTSPLCPRAFDEQYFTAHRPAGERDATAIALGTAEGDTPAPDPEPAPGGGLAEKGFNAGSGTTGESVKLLPFDTAVAAIAYLKSEGLRHCWDAAVFERVSV